MEEIITPKESKTENAINEAHLPWWVLLLISVGSVLLFLLLFILFNARLIFKYYYGKATNSVIPEEKAYWIFKSSEFLYCQFGYYRNQRTPLEFAQNVIKPELGIDYADFVNVHHKIKYDKLPADTNDVRVMNQYHSTYPDLVFSNYTFLQRNLKFMNLISTIKFFFN